MADINTISKEMNKLSTTLEEAKRSEAKYTGQLEVLMKRLKEEHGLESVGLAEQKVKELEELEQKMLAEIETSFKELQEAYEW